MVALPCEPPLQLGGPLLAIAPLSARPPGLPMACEFLLTLSLLSFSFLLQTWRWCEASVSFSLLLGCAGSILWRLLPWFLLSSFPCLTPSFIHPLLAVLCSKACVVSVTPLPSPRILVTAQDRS